jgi:hypothetical protein
MHPGDRLGPLPDGATCTACGAGVPARRIRILAHRDDLAFVELACPSCGSSALGLLLAADEPGDPPVLDVASDAAAAPTMSTAIGAADVTAMRDYLAAWDGDLRGLLAGGR